MTFEVYVTLAEAARQLRCDYRTVKKLLLVYPNLPHEIVGSRIKIRVTDLPTYSDKLKEYANSQLASTPA